MAKKYTKLTKDIAKLKLKNTSSAKTVKPKGKQTRIKSGIVKRHVRKIDQPIQRKSKIQKNYEIIKSKGATIRFSTFKKMVEKSKSYNRKVRYYKKKGHDLAEYVVFPNYNSNYWTKETIEKKTKKRLQTLKKYEQRGKVGKIAVRQLEQHIRTLKKAKVSGYIIEKVKKLSPSEFRSYDEKLFELTALHFYDTDEDVLQYVENIDESVLSAYEYAKGHVQSGKTN